MLTSCWSQSSIVSPSRLIYTWRGKDGWKFVLWSRYIAGFQFKNLVVRARSIERPLRVRRPRFVGLIIMQRIVSERCCEASKSALTTLCPRFDFVIERWTESTRRVGQLYTVRTSRMILFSRARADTSKCKHQYVCVSVFHTRMCSHYVLWRLTNSNCWVSRLFNRDI